MSTPSSDKRKNYHTIRYGTSEGEIKMGHLHRDNEISGAMLRSGESSSKGIHYVSLESSGDKPRKNGTMCSSPGAFQVKAGYDLGNDGESEENEYTGIYMDAVNGDIVIRAPSGRIRLEALDVDIKATGSGNKKGTININANEKVIIKAQTIDVSSKVSTRLFSEKTVECIGRGILNIYGGFVDVADGATEVVGSKLPSSNEIQNRSII
jgi:hypothetical protein